MIRVIGFWYHHKIAGNFTQLLRNKTKISIFLNYSN